MNFDSAPPPHSDSCPFCAIGAAYPPLDPSSPAPSFPDAESSKLSPQAFVVLRTKLCLAFLDIMPLSPGHLLVCTRAHHEKISDVTREEAEELGGWLRVLSRVLAGVTGVWDWNLVQNNGVLTDSSRTWFTSKPQS